MSSVSAISSCVHYKTDQFHHDQPVVVTAVPWIDYDFLHLYGAWMIAAWNGVLWCYRSECAQVLWFECRHLHIDFNVLNLGMELHHCFLLNAWSCSRLIVQPFSLCKTNFESDRGAAFCFSSFSSSSMSVALFCLLTGPNHNLWCDQPSSSCWRSCPSFWWTVVYLNMQTAIFREMFSSSVEYDDWFANR